MTLDAFLSSPGARRLLRGTLPTQLAERANPVQLAKAPLNAAPAPAAKQPAKPRK